MTVRHPTTVWTRENYQTVERLGLGTSHDRLFNQW
jgi:hypothetical protein